MTVIVRSLCTSNFDMFQDLEFFQCSTFFQKFSFSIFEHDFPVIRIFRNRKSILFDIEKLTFKVLTDFKNFENVRLLSFFIKKSPGEMIFAKVSLPFGAEISI